MKMENGKWRMENGRWKTFLITFHFSLSIFNSLASTHLSSPSLGTFFGIPSWLGDPNVPSERTYGSPDATNATHRIDNDALKAVAALFEGFEERAYYASEGPSNVWDVATWGPTARGANKVPFRFDFGRVGWEAFAYSPDDDRRVATRRFVEYDNVGSLALGLRRWTNPPEDDVRLWDRVAVRRPHWRGGSSTQTGTRPGWLWSSTLFDGLRPGGVVPQIPTFEWSKASTMLEYSPDEWGCSTLTWEDVARPNADPLNWRSGRLSQYRPILSMMHGVNYGDPPFDDNRWYDRFGGAFYTLTNTTCGVLEMPFAGHVTWKERVMSGSMIADTWEDIQQMDRSGYCLADGVWRAIDDAQWDDLSYLENFDVSGTITPDESVPFWMEEDGLFSNWHFVDLTIFRHKTGETIHVDNGDGFSGILIPTESLSFVVNWDDMISFLGSVRRESFGDLEPTGGRFEALATFNGHDAHLHEKISIYLFRMAGGEAKNQYDLGTVSYLVPRSNSVSRVRDFPTNDTRRLVTDRVAGLGQALSGLDRTYAPMNADAPAAKTTYSGDMLMGSDVVTYGGLTWDSDAYGVAVRCSQTPVAFSGFAEITNYMYVTNGPVLSRPGYVVAGCSESSDVLTIGNCQIVSNIDVFAKIDDAEALFRVIGPPPEPGQESRVYEVSRMTYTMTSPGRGVFSAGFALCPRTSSSPVYYYEEPFEIQLTNILLSANASYSRSYSSAESVLTNGVLFGPGDDGILYPGSFDRVATADLWTIESFMSASKWSSTEVDMSDPLFYGRYGSGCDDVLYRSQVGRYVSHSGLRRRFGDIFEEQLDKCVTYVKNELFAAESTSGGDFRNPLAVIPMKGSDAAAGLDGHVVPVVDRPGGWLIARLYPAPPPQDYVYYIVVTEDRVLLETRDGGYVDFPWPMTFVHLSFSARPATWKDGDVQHPDCHHIWGAAAKAKTRGMSKVDWDWNALKRD